MKVLAFNGSPRKDGNTSILINYALKELKKEGIDTKVIQLGGKNIRGCVACYQCFENKDQTCAITSDSLNDYIEEIVEADGLILGSPTYFSDITAELKAFIDRVGLVSKANDDMLKRKVGAAIVAVRRAGSCHAFSSINYFFLISQMIVPGSCYWNMGIGMDKGDVRDDEEGIKTMQTLGQNMAWLLKKTR